MVPRIQFYVSRLLGLYLGGTACVTLNQMEQLQEGCRRIGRNLNDTRGLMHSFRDSRETMIRLFNALKALDYSDWEICFELRIRI